MPGTAIVTVYTRDGFVVAADGRKRQGQEVISESEQKIYPVDRKWDKLAWALAGITTIPKEDSPTEDLFDFRKAVSNSLSTLRNKQPLHFAQFVSRLAGLLNRSLESLWREYPDLPFPPDPHGEGSIAKLIIAGYYSATPVMGRITHRHNDRKFVRRPITKVLMASPGDWEIMMPSKLGVALHNGDERLSDYITEPVKKMFVRQPMNLDEAQEAAVKCIEACTGAAAHEIDPDSETVGGSIHVAAITKDSGFSWVMPPT